LIAAVAVLLPACSTLAPTAARATSLTYAVSGNISGEGPVNAQATFTAENGDIKVVLTNLGPTSSMGSAQAISELFFQVNGTTLKSSDMTFSSYSGPTITYNDNNSATTGSASFSGGTLSDGHWGFGSIDTNSLELASVQRGGNDNVAPGGQPEYMIMAQNATPNGNVTNFDPYFNGTATFIIADPNVTKYTVLSASNIFNVQFGFGTGPEATLDATPVLTPEPASLIQLGTAAGMLLPVLFGRLRRRRVAEA
jgi:hypothetical protein